MRDHADQATAFLAVGGNSYKGPPITDECTGRATDYKFTSGRHVPGCAGSCGIAGLHPNGRSAVADSSDPNCMQMRANAKKVNLRVD